MLSKIKNNGLLYKKYLISIPVLLLIIWLLIPLNLFKNNYSTVVLDENNQILRIFLNKDEQWYFPPDKNLKVPDKLKKAIVYFEDRYFYYHPGINLIALSKSFIENISHHRVIRGGSTITMQVARISAPKNRTYFNKIKEIFLAFKIELWNSKDKILQMYVDHAPYGGNIIGYQAASLRYYKKNPEQLTWGESVTLAVLPNAPGLISPVSNKNILLNKRNSLLYTLFQAKEIDEETYKLAVREPVPEKLNEIEITAPHLSQELKNQFSKDISIISTTIIKEQQQSIEAIVKNHIKYLKSKGIKNASVVVADTKTGKIRAYVGSQDFYDKESKGEVDGVIAPRSTGSILKPFLYALSMDDGIILPQTIVKDVPTYFGSYAPENSDKKFSGIVIAQDALIRSLNVPAVSLLNNFGVYEFYTFLKKAGISTLFRKSDDYGLTLILGGAEATLLDLAGIYRGLANYGKFTPLTITPYQQIKDDAKTLISPGASYLTLNVLKELKRPDAEFFWQQYENQFKVAWKTGTSFGNRDAWAVGVNPQWTVAVWVGNFTGEGNSNLAGAVSAGSLMFDIYNYLPKDKSKVWFEKPYQDLTNIEICQETGFKAGLYCTHKMRVEAPIAMKPLKICPYHKNIFVTNDESHQVCSLCWQRGNYKTINKLFYPPDVVQYLRERGQITDEIPPHKEDCPSVSQNLSLQIIYPEPMAKLWLPRDVDGVLQKLTLRIAHRQKSSIVYWYIDNKFIGSSTELHSKSIDIKKGWHSLEVVDENGNRDQRKFFVDLKKS